jgi:hypothetical protein
MWKEGINKWWNSSWENSLSELKEENWLKLYVENEVINEWKFWCKPQLNKNNNIMCFKFRHVGEIIM